MKKCVPIYNIRGERFFFYFHYLYKSMNAGIIIYYSGKKWHELCATLQRLGDDCVL